MVIEPLERQSGHLFQRAGLFEEMSRPRDDHEPFFHPQPGQCFLVHRDYRPISSAYKRSTIREAVRFLAGKGFITVSDNPNPKYRFDRTKHFLFHPDTVNAWLRAHPLKVTDGAVESTDCHPLEIRDGAVENSGAIPETTPEIPNEKEIDPGLARFWAMTLDYATLPDKRSREVHTMQPCTWTAGVLTLQAPAYLARRRALAHELFRLLAPVAPVELREVRIVNGQ
jgi:hypothetical protein